MEFEVEVISIRKRFRAADDESILAAALRNKVSLNFKCGNGSCKACHTHLVSGSVAYPWKQPRALSEEEMAQGSILICQAAATSDIRIDAKVRTGLMEEVRLHELKLAMDGIAIRRGLATITGLERASHDVTILRLAPDEMPNWLPGQYLTIGANGLERDFSIANLPGPNSHFELQIRHVPGGRFTSWIADGISIGDVVSWEGPLGTFFHRRKSQRPMLLVARGTGFSPIKSVVLSALAQVQNVPMRLYWGVRSQRDLYQDALAHEWAESGGLAYFPVLSEPGAGEERFAQTGIVHEIIAQKEGNLGAFDVYIAGPPPMVEAVRRVVVEKGAREDRIFTDAFDFSVTTQNQVATGERDAANPE